jgi:hypothetical protein
VPPPNTSTTTSGHRTKQQPYAAFRCSPLTATATEVRQIRLSTNQGTQGQYNLPSLPIYERVPISPGATSLQLDADIANGSAGGISCTLDVTESDSSPTYATAKSASGSGAQLSVSLCPQGDPTTSTWGGCGATGSTGNTP